MDHIHVQALMRKFTAPLAGYVATSPARKEGVKMLAQNLWAAMIAGPDMEEVTWRVFKETANLDDESLQSLKDVYLKQMKPVVSEEQLAELRERYHVPGKAKPPEAWADLLKKAARPRK